MSSDEHQRLSDVLSYDESTGLLHWKQTVARNVKIGSVAGSVRSDGYLVVRYKGEQYPAHRLAFFLKNNRWPEGEVDHINGDKSDNRWINLREATRSENMRNRGSYIRNTSGFKGVSKQGKKWRANICSNGVRTYLGCFLTKEEAFAVYQRAAREQHGNFANIE